MGCVIVIAVHRARADHADGAVGRTGLHGTSLYRRGLGPHEEFIGQIERVLHVAGRMILRQVQCLKVKIVIFNFRTFGDFKAHAHEDLFDLTQGERHRMQMPFGCLAARQGHVNLFRRHFSSSWRASSSFIWSAMRASTLLRTSFTILPTFGRSSAATLPRPRRISVRAPFCPNTAHGCFSGHPHI